MCWRCAHLTTHHEMQPGQQLAGCTCDQTEIYPSAAVQHIPVLTRIASRMTRNDADAQDLVQDTMIRAVGRWLTYQPGTSVRRWLITILQNAFINAYRKRRRHERFDTERPIDVLYSMHASNGDDAELNDIRDIAPLVNKAIRELPPKYREVLVRADIQGQKYRDIAAELGMPMGSVMSVLFRARKALEAPMAEAAADYGITVRRRVSR